MAEEFGECQECKNIIMVGDEMISLTLSTDLVTSESSVQPQKAASIGLWCTLCAPLVIKRISGLTSP